jgi:RimJ/RimL family protein N-acetyltransferase
MKITECKLQAKHGRNIVLRSPELSDAEELLAYLIQSAGETDFLTKYPEEITLTLEDEKNYITKQLNSEINFDLAAFVDGKLAGNCSIFSIGSQIKMKHRAGFGIAILKDYWNIGIGSLLIEYCIENAKRLGYEQIELEVVSENKNAIKLYEKHGFQTCGVISNAQKLKDGTYQDLMLMICRL